MATQSQSTPKDFFLWLGAIAALYFSVGSLVALLFSLIDQTLTVNVIGYDPYSGGMSFAIAVLLIIFPLYLILTRINNNRMRDAQVADSSWARKWGIYLTLFISGGAMMIDLVTLVYTFLQGDEMTAGFLLKVLVVLVVFGAVFLYYLKDINNYWRSKEKLSKRIGAGVVIVVIVSIISGFFIMGSPATQRALKYDRQRISHLESTQYSITDYYRTKQALPESLEALADPLAGRGYFQRDPKTGEAYEYAVVDSEGTDPTFQLCAIFELGSPVIDEGNMTGEYSDWRVQELIQENEQWGHEAGRTCYTRTVDPEKYEKGTLLPSSIRID